MAHKNQKASRKALWAVKAKLGCKNCGCDDPDQLLFHHRDPSTKLFDIASGNRKWAKVLEECTKCDILCASCHVTHHNKVNPKKYSVPKDSAAMYQKLKRVRDGVQIVRSIYYD